MIKKVFLLKPHNASVNSQNNVPVSNFFSSNCMQSQSLSIKQKQDITNYVHVKLAIVLQTREVVFECLYNKVDLYCVLVSCPRRKITCRHIFEIVFLLLVYLTILFQASSSIAYDLRCQFYKEKIK